ncbi:hypothetical protein EC988_007161, partial [Linderina pennispora]
MASALSSRRIVGLLLLLCVVFIWVGSSFLVSNLFGEQDFNHPFFITYLNTGTFSFYLVGAYFSRRHSHDRIGQRKRSASEESLSSQTSEEGSPLVSDGQPAQHSHAPPLVQAKLTVRETVQLG